MWYDFMLTVARQWITRPILATVFAVCLGGVVTFGAWWLLGIMWSILVDVVEGVKDLVRRYWGGVVIVVKLFCFMFISVVVGMLFFFSSVSRHEAFLDETANVVFAVTGWALDAATSQWNVVVQTLKAVWYFNVTAAAPPPTPSAPAPTPLVTFTGLARLCYMTQTGMVCSDDDTN